MHEPVVWYLVQTKEPQLFYHRNRRNIVTVGDFSRHLEPDLNNLQRVCEENLRSSSLRRRKKMIECIQLTPAHV